MVAAGPAGLDPQVAANCPARLLQPLHEGRDAGLRFRLIGRRVHQHANATHSLGLLRARRERPSGCRAADERDELAPPHSITSSARATSIGGISRPKIFAVCRLMTNSNLVDCSTGSSAGLAPRRMRPA